jgi:hypothetical protein
MNMQRFLENAAITGTVLLNMIITGASGAADAEPNRDPNVGVVSMGLNCLAAQEWVRNDFRDLGLNLGESALIRYGLGNIPGTLPKKPHVVNLIVYSPDQKNAWMLFFRRKSDGRSSAVRNAYRLTRVDSRWVAGEGNGGIATYNAVGAYATKMSKQQAVRVTLQADAKECLLEE